MPGASVAGTRGAGVGRRRCARNREPRHPPVVGYAEIARMTGVTRQRAYAFPRIESFPKPVIETSQGPLYSEDAVRAWAQTRELRARTSGSDGIGNDARAPRPHGAGFIFTRRKRLFPDGFVGKGIGCHQVRSGWITGRASRSLSRSDWVIRAWAPSSITVQVVGDTVLSPACRSGTPG